MSARDDRVPLLLGLAVRLLPADVREEVLGDLLELWRTEVSHQPWARRVLWLLRQPLAAAISRLRFGGPFLDGLRQDLAYAIRSLRRAPGVTTGIVITLALGLGVNMAMFSFLDVVFLRPPAGVREPGEVRRVWTEIQFRSGAQFWSGFSYPQYAAVRSALGGRVSTTLYLSPSDMWLRHEGRELEASTSYTAANYFGLLGVRPVLGRFFTAEEDRLGAGASVAVVSQAFWQRQLGGDPSVLGGEVLIASRPYAIIGVAGERFTGVELDATDIWLPLGSGRAGATPWWTTHSANGFQIVLRPPADMEDAAVTERVANGLRSPEALRRPADTATVVRLGSIIRAQGPGDKDQEVRIATRLAGVTIIVLLIAGANVINLLLARAVRRRRETAVRLAMGISRSRLARLILTETVLLALLATAAGVLAAYWGGALLRGLLLPGVQWADSATPMHWRVIALALATGIGAGLVAGLLPAIQAVKTELTGALKAGAADGHARRSRVRSALVIAQAALSVVLLVGAGLLVSSLANVRALRTGFDTRRIVLGGVSFETPDSARDARLPQAFAGMVDRLRGAPGVEEIALAKVAPTRGFSTIDYHPDVDTTQYPKPFATYNVVSPEFFAATGTRVLRGEDFPRRVGAMPTVAIVNEAMARAQWPGMDVLGRCLRFASDGPCYGIIGVVETALFGELLEDPHPQFYLPADNPPAEAGRWYPSLASLLVKAMPGARDAAIAEVQRVLGETFPGGRTSISTMERLLEPEYRPWRLGATLFTAFGLLALIVAAVGIYGTVSYAVAQRTHEFGIRAALGARASDILRHVIGGSLRTVTIGVAAGIVLAIAGGRLVAALLYGIEPGEPRVMLGVATALLVIAALAAFGPARRAARADPAAALRAE
ncbi:MAG: ADOP family duplicated permease [Longimicrobiales bacterium]